MHKSSFESHFNKFVLLFSPHFVFFEPFRMSQNMEMRRKRVWVFNVIFGWEKLPTQVVGINRLFAVLSSEGEQAKMYRRLKF